MPTITDIDLKDDLGDSQNEGLILKPEKYWGIWAEQHENDVWIIHRKAPHGATKEIDFMPYFGTPSYGDMFRLVNDSVPLKDKENMEILVWFTGTKFKCGTPP